MEALLLLLGAVVGAPLILGLIVEGMAALLSLLALLLELFFGIVLQSRSKSESIPPKVLAARKERSARRFRFIKRCAVVLVALFLLSATVVAVLNFFFFESALRWG